ncbi:hypothetical protein GALL_285350 [mine drainage metagenome]|uniref:Antitoxin Xre/MbcA/ParS-like toxin-binding domain-containing protein n=1 Tax=mine drainage metagenome TaxID=410659 RepID=A0A1J5RC10_9ZZZZ
MSYPRCLGSCSVDETDEFNFKRVLKATPEMDNNLVINPNQDYKKLLELGLRKLGGQKAFYDWMSKAKVALDGKRPIDVICYNEGYSNVMDLLGKFNQ